MEYVEGRPLSTMLQLEGQLPVDELLNIFMQILEAISYAHGQPQQIIHRDLTPDNVMIKPDGRVKILDFGISKTLQWRNLTQTDIILGKPLYMAPEQFEGEVTVFTDQYALGVMLYEMLTGMIPFEGDSPIVLYKRHMEEAIRLPPSLVESLPDYLVRSLYKSLAKHADQRFDSVAEFLSVLESKNWPESCQAAVEALHHEAVMAFRRHDLEEAETLLNRVLQADENHQDAQKLRDTCRREREQIAALKKAEWAYRAAVEAHSRHADIAEIRSHLRAFLASSIKLTQIRPILKHYRRAKRKFPELTEQLRAELSNSPAARDRLSALEDARSTEPTSVGSPAQEPPGLKKKNSPPRRIGFFRKGIDALRREDYETAVSYLRPVVENHPNHVEAARYLTLAEESFEREERSNRQRVARNQMIEKIFQEGVQLFENWEYQAAISRFRQVLTLDAEHNAAQELMEDAHSRLKDADQIEEISLFYNQGMTFFQCRKFEEALTCFEQVISRFPGHRGAREYKRRSQQGRKQARLVDDLISDGITLFREGQYTQALTHFSKTLALDKGNRDARRYKQLCEELARASGS